MIKMAYTLNKFATTTVPGNFESTHKYRKKRNIVKDQKSSGDGLPVERHLILIAYIKVSLKNKCKVCELRRSPRKRSSAETCNDASVLNILSSATVPKKNAI